MNLYQIIKNEVIEWRNNGYISDFEALTEIFEYINKQNYLRQAQIEALESYWYVRNILGSPTIEKLYKRYFSGNALLTAFGVPEDKFSGLDSIPDEKMRTQAYQAIIDRIKSDDDFVKQYRLDGVRETLTLSYPSYILALAMGAGKTILIASIIATEFTLALENLDKPFIKNALVFAPGKTILGALREISFAPYEQILPKRLFKRFITNVKFIYTQDNQKDINVNKGSIFNVIITNTEKIRLTKESIRKNQLKLVFKNETKEDEIKNLIANQRLETLTSLPDLGIFSDEAHHTYGQKIGRDLKKVRQTIDYIAGKTDLRVVVNTTGTPYYKKKVLKDVIYWYGLAQGIKDGILKEVTENIKSFDDVKDSLFVRAVTEDFINAYWNLQIYNGAKAKLAFYFPQIEHIREAKEHIEKVLIKQNISPNEVLLEVHNKSSAETADLFDNRINDPNVPFRIFLLVNKGTEGWNCPSLFATALARELKSSNNFCLQAASRCLRQVPDNNTRAKIYLSKKNIKILARQLQETYGETLDNIGLLTFAQKMQVRLKIRKKNIEPVLIKEKVKKVILKNSIDKSKLYFPKQDAKPKTYKVLLSSFNLTETNGNILKKIDEKTVLFEEPTSDIYCTAAELADIYRLESLKVIKLLKQAFGDITEIPLSVIDKLKETIEKQLSGYEIIEETIERALAILKLEGFSIDKETGDYYTEIRVNKTRFENLFLDKKEYPDIDFGFHYTPYNFDSRPEKNFFISMLLKINTKPDDIEDIYFTGAITSNDKTDIMFEYKGQDNKWHTYTPDFIIRKKDGKVLIIEIKGEPYKNRASEKAMKEITDLNKDKIQYEIIETDSDKIASGKLEYVFDLIDKG